MAGSRQRIDLERVQRLKLRTRRLVDSAYSGDYHSTFKGRGLEFAEVRDYAPGDDVRAIDWNMTARAGRPFVKLFVEERELTVILLVDISASTRTTLAGAPKAEVIALAAATLAMSALRHNDRVGLILFDDQVRHMVRPSKGRNHVIAIIEAILAATGGDATAVAAGEPRGTDLGAALDRLAATVRVRTMAFLISDFFAAPYERALRRAVRRHDLVPIAIRDAYDEALPAAGLVHAVDPETGRAILIDSDDATTRTRYAEHRRTAWAANTRLFGQLGLDHGEIETGEAVLPPLMRLFHNRARRRGRAR